MKLSLHVQSLYSVSGKLFSHVVHQTHWLCWKLLPSQLGWPLTPGVSTQKPACLTVRCASLRMRLWIIVVIAEANEF